MTFQADYTKSRTLSLNTTSYQLVESLSDKFTFGFGYTMPEFNKVLRMKKTKNFSNDLTLNLSFSLAKTRSLIRKIEEGTTQATSGNLTKTLEFSANYGLSRALTLRAFYDLQVNNPLISSTSYPTTDSSFGISLVFSLAQ